MERLSRVRDTLIQRSLERSSGGYWPEQTLEEVGQYLDKADRYQTQGVPAYWNLNGSTEQVLAREDDEMVREIMYRFSSYSEAAAWYRSRPCLVLLALQPPLSSAKDALKRLSNISKESMPESSHRNALAKVGREDELADGPLAREGRSAGTWNLAFELFASRRTTERREIV